jgi:hypothetical protein
MIEPAGKGHRTGMTEIDTAAEIDIVWHDQQVTVSIPLAGAVPLEWSSRYDELARHADLEAQAQEHPGRTWIVVTMPAATGRSGMVATLDAARDLVAKADVAEEPADAEDAAAMIREWWADQRG